MMIYDSNIEATVSSGIVKDRHHTIESYFGTLKMFDPIGVANWPFKWPTFIHTGSDTGMCLSHVRHTAMLHSRVSPRVPYNCKSGSSTAKAQGHVASRVAQVRFDHGQGTQACLVAM
ncbi:Exosome complex component RRP43 [Gossypium arboreum]|uniref:Exosome complex component RRP43 n=1 Tax=Gossypium arboreum TaxID=29729 RepID=A0A0B0MBD0_GOSAR|nr:Exosome complex component RRP43 [Gossypium arboreum]KHG11993.1 Exosome complex component RRP43 [Gossypium arboreum]